MNTVQKDNINFQLFNLFLFYRMARLAGGDPVCCGQ
jgi:hypothetical protein